jgi:thymidylate synthase
MYQRSVDSFLGLPFNITCYSLLTHMVAQQCHLEVGEFVWTGGDCHIYSNHIEQVQLQLSRNPYPLPKLIIHQRPASILDYHYQDFEIVDYKSHPRIQAPVAV